MKYIKIYSVNVAAYLYLLAKIEPILQLDDKGSVYFLFNDTPEISLMINVYRGNQVSVNLKGFLNAYRVIRSKMYEAKRGA